MPFQGVLSPIIIVKQWSFRMFFLILHFCPHLLLIWALSIIIVKQCPFRMFFLQPSLSNNALSGCSFSNHHCQTMPFQGVLSPIIIVKQCPLRVSFLICVCPHLLLSIVNHHCQTMPSQDFLSHFAFLSPPSFENLSIVDKSSLSNSALSGIPFSFCVSLPTILPLQYGEVSSLSVPPKQLGLQLSWSTGILVCPKQFPLTSKVTQTISPQKGHFSL